MSELETQPGVRVNKSLWKEFRQDVRDRKGVVKGHLKHELETAISEYINASEGGDTHDRLRRIENELESLHTLVEEHDEKKKDSDVSSETENKLKKITGQIERESDGMPKVHDEVVELAIRDNAGGSDPTIRRYKRLLQQDNELFEHPTNENIWFRDATDYVLAVNSMRKGGKLDYSKYDDLVSEHGEEWWLAQQPDDIEDGSKGFQ